MYLISHFFKSHFSKKAVVPTLRESDIPQVYGKNSSLSLLPFAIHELVLFIISSCALI